MLNRGSVARNLAIAFLFMGRMQAPAQEAPAQVSLSRTLQHTLHSEEAGISYKLYLALPESYGQENRTYPVVFLLDADYAFGIARNVLDHLAARNDLPEAILVGIAYAGPHVPTGGYRPEFQAVSGGGPGFKAFLTRELIPFIEHEYAASTDRYLVGHSYGGLFTMWTALTVPEFFRGFIVVSPSLWYDDGLLFRVEEEMARGRTDLPLRLYMVVGSREINAQHDMVADLRRMATTLAGRGYPGLRLRWEVAEDETHNSVFPRGLSNGLRFALEGR